MAKIRDLFDKYSEELVVNSIQGRLLGEGFEKLSGSCPLEIEFMKSVEPDLLFRYKKGRDEGTLRFSPLQVLSGETFAPYPQIRGLFQLSNLDIQKKEGQINFIPSGYGRFFDGDLTIGVSELYIASRVANSRRGESVADVLRQLERDFIYESPLGDYILVESYPNKEDNKTLHGLRFSANIRLQDGKYILEKTSKRALGDIDAFCGYQLVRYPSIKLVEVGQAKEALNKIEDRTSKGDTLLSIWEEYSEREHARVRNLKEQLTHIPYTIDKNKGEHIRVLKLAPSEEQSKIFEESDSELKSSSFEDAAMQGQDTYKVESLYQKYGFTFLEVRDKDDTLAQSGELVLSDRGDEYVKKRRLRAYQKLRMGDNLLLRNLHFAIEDEAASMICVKHKSIPPLTERTKAFLKTRFGVDRLTQNQIDAIEIALNTPDVAVIQGPPGTGKSTVIAAICDRLFEEEERGKAELQDSSKLILLSAFQNDTVEHIASKVEYNGLPTVKIGKEATNSQAEELVISRMTEAMDKALQEYAPSSRMRRLSVTVKRLRDVYVEDGNIGALIQSVGALLGSLSLDKDLWDEWLDMTKSSDTGTSPNIDKQIRALRSLSTDEVSYNDSGYIEVRRLLKSGLVCTEAERCLLEQAPVAAPDEDFLKSLKSLKEKYLEELVTAPEVMSAGRRDDVISWLNDVIKVERVAEENRYTDRDTFIVANIEALREELKGMRAYMRDSILKYCDSVATTNQKAGSYEVQGSFANVILEEAARSNPLDLLIPMARACRRIILVGDQRQLPQLVEHDIVSDIVTRFDDIAEREALRSKYEESLFGVLYNNLGKATRLRRIRLTEQFRMHPAIGDFISRLYYDGELLSGMPNQAETKAHGLTTLGLQGKVMAFCDVPKLRGMEKRNMGISRECEADRVMKLVESILSDPASADLSIGIITFYAAQRELLFKKAELSGFANRGVEGYEISNNYRLLNDGRERLRIGTVDSFQGKEFDIVILSATRSNKIERKDGNIRQVFGFLVSDNRLNVAFSRAQRLLIVCGDAEMFKDEYAQTHIGGLYEFYVNETTKEYGARI